MPRESPYRVAIANANVPNMLGQISTTMAKAGLNIHNMVNKSRGEMAYTLVDVDSPIDDARDPVDRRDRRRAVGAGDPGGDGRLTAGQRGRRYVRATQRGARRSRPPRRERVGVRAPARDANVARGARRCAPPLRAVPRPGWGWRVRAPGTGAGRRQPRVDVSTGRTPLT